MVLCKGIADGVCICMIFIHKMGLFRSKISSDIRGQENVTSDLNRLSSSVPPIGDKNQIFARKLKSIHRVFWVSGFQTGNLSACGPPRVPGVHEMSVFKLF